MRVVLGTYYLSVIESSLNPDRREKMGGYVYALGDQIFENYDGRYKRLQVPAFPSYDYSRFSFNARVAELI